MAMARRGGELRRGGCRARVLGGGDDGGDGETGPAGGGWRRPSSRVQIGGFFLLLFFLLAGGENACATLPEDTRELLVLEWARLGCHGCQ